MRHDLGERDVRRLVAQCQDPGGMDLEPMRAPVVPDTAREGRLRLLTAQLTTFAIPDRAQAAAAGSA
jgi:hypothetical protein